MTSRNGNLWSTSYSMVNLIEGSILLTKLPAIPSIVHVQQKFNRELRKIANSSDNQEQKTIILDNLSNKIPNLPYFYGIPKIHKPGCPLRPIIATCNAPQTRLAEWLAGILSPLSGKFSNSPLDSFG